MKREEGTLHDALEAVYGPTPEMFHRRVQETLCALRAQRVNTERQTRGKLRWGAMLLAALLLMASLGAAAKLSGVLEWITQTAAKNWVLDDARNMLHEDVSQTKINDCIISLSEWLCDGKRLYACVSVIDPGFRQDRESDALHRYAARYSLGAVQLSEGETVGGMTWDDAAGEADGEILYLIEQELRNVPDAFDVSIPVYFPDGKFSVRFHVTREDFGRIQDFEPSPTMQGQGYTAQISALRATALHTYGRLTLAFDAAMPVKERRAIVLAYMDGLGVPDGQLDIEEGNGEELLLARHASWSQDSLTCEIDLEGNPRERYPDRITYCPRWPVAEDEESCGRPPLSPDGAVVMDIQERSGSK